VYDTSLWPTEVEIQVEEVAISKFPKVKSESDPVTAAPKLLIL
jgi:hypothetical protein